MHEATFSPSPSKVITLWLSMAAVVMALVFILNWREIRDLTPLLLVTLCVLVQTLVLSGIFYLLPYFKIEVKDGRLHGPSSWGWFWRRTQLPIGELDLSSINSSFGWLGIHLIKSKSGGSISVWFLDEDKFNRLLGSLRKNAVA